MRQTIYYGGPILTMEPGSDPEAVLVRDGTIAAVGPLRELEDRARGAERQDLKGHALLPAFLDPHSHLTALASTLDLCPLGAAESFDDVAARLKAFQETHALPEEAWVVGFGYDHNVLAERRQPDRHALDSLFPRTPVLISNASGHMGVVNSAGLKALGITPETPDPEGGRIGREADGITPNGYLEENAFLRMAAVMPAPSPEQALDHLARAQEVYLSHGITLIQDGMTGAENWSQLATLAAGGGLRARVVAYADMKNAPQVAAESPVNKLSAGGYKIFLDGSPQGRTAWMLEPYAQGPEGQGYRGYPTYSDGQVTGFLKTALTQGRQILAHCNGDAAAEQFIRCCRAAQEETGLSVRSIRPVMIHAQLVRLEQLTEMARLGILPSFLAAHVWYWGDVHVENFGAARAASISPLKWASDLGIPFTMHQDTPVIQPDMLESVWCAVNRVTRSGQVLGPELRVDVMTALRAVTVNAAYQYFLEEERGSIRAGKAADFVVLDADPRAVDAMKLRELRVLETIAAGECVWRLT